MKFGNLSDAEITFSDFVFSTFYLTQFAGNAGKLQENMVFGIRTSSMVIFLKVTFQEIYFCRKKLLIHLDCQQGCLILSIHSDYCQDFRRRVLKGVPHKILEAVDHFHGHF